MALGVPASVTTLTTITKTWSDAMRDSLLWAVTDAPTCRVYNSASISITTSGTAQALTFDSEAFDVGGCHSTSVNTGRITVPSGAGGKWVIGGEIRFATNATGYRIAGLRLNGSTILAQSVRSSVSTNVQEHVQVQTIYSLAAGDYVELMATQTSGGALNAEALASSAPLFYAYWMRT
jgi:hypothetical protein